MHLGRNQDDMMNFAINDPDALFNHVCMHLSDEGRFDRETAELAQQYNLEWEIPEEKIPQVQDACDQTYDYMDTLSFEQKKTGQKPDE